MTPRESTHVIAGSVGALVDGADVTDGVAALLDDAAEVMKAQAVGVVVVTASGELDVLAATCHDRDELELHHAQFLAGPCATAIADGTAVVVTDLADLGRRWPQVEPLVRAAGHTAVHAFPLRWHGVVLGALNVFHGDPSPPDPDLPVLGQVYADLVSSMLLRPTRLTREVLHERVGAALDGRTVIEQAKGVLAHEEGVDMEVAYARLRRRADEQQESVTDVARQVIETALRGKDR